MFTDPEKAKAVFLGWLIEHPSVKPTLETSTLFAEYLRTNGLQCTSKNLDAAYASLKATGKLPSTPEEAAQATRLAVLRKIADAVSERLLPAKIGLNPEGSNFQQINKWALDHGVNLNVETVLAAIKALAVQLEWQVPPAGLSKLRQSAETGFEDSRDTVRRFNHAEESKTKAEIAAAKKKFSQDMNAQARAEELQVIESLVADYQANAGPLNRPNRGQTEYCQQLIRSIAKKFNSSAREIRNLIRELSGEPSDISYLRNKLAQAQAAPTTEVSEPPAPRIGPPSVLMS